VLPRTGAGSSIYALLGVLLMVVGSVAILATRPRGTHQ
jgi:LPXTG-motif cell wall-anchored protein